MVDCHKIVESGCLSFLIGSLSSYCDDVRLAAFHCLTLFKSHMEGARFRDKSQVWNLCRHSPSRVWRGGGPCVGTAPPMCGGEVVLV